MKPNIEKLETFNRIDVEMKMSLNQWVVIIYCLVMYLYILTKYDLTSTEHLVSICTLIRSLIDQTGISVDELKCAIGAGVVVSGIDAIMKVTDNAEAG